jgi:hypothetical protein
MYSLLRFNPQLVTLGHLETGQSGPTRITITWQQSCCNTSSVPGFTLRIISNLLLAAIMLNDLLSPRHLGFSIKYTFLLDGLEYHDPIFERKILNPNSTATLLTAIQNALPITPRSSHYCSCSIRLPLRTRHLCPG